MATAGGVEAGGMGAGCGPVVERVGKGSGRGLQSGDSGWGTGNVWGHEAGLLGLFPAFDIPCPKSAHPEPQHCPAGEKGQWRSQQGSLQESVTISVLHPHLFPYL